MAGDDIAFLSAGALTGLYPAGKLSPVESAQALFAWLDDLPPHKPGVCCAATGERG